MYPGAFKHYPNLTRFECIGHLRRYVREAVKAGEEQALPLLKDITQPYRIETSKRPRCRRAPSGAGSEL